VNGIVTWLCVIPSLDTAHTSASRKTMPSHECILLNLGWRQAAHGGIKARSVMSQDRGTCGLLPFRDERCDHPTQSTATFRINLLASAGVS
jgi:hypothetical protein